MSSKAVGIICQKCNANAITENMGVFTLKENTPVMIDSENNRLILNIYEEIEVKEEEKVRIVKEDLYIYSKLDSDREQCAVVGNEYELPETKSKKTDLSYYYFCVEQGNIKEIRVYLYDMKRKLSGEQQILKLIEQWKASIEIAQESIKPLINGDLLPDQIKLGVITEDIAEENRIFKRKEREEKIKAIKAQPKQMDSDEKSPYTHIQFKAKMLPELIKKNDILNEFDKGEVKISGNTYKYDIRLFRNSNNNKKEHNMLFVNGILI